MVQMRQHQYLPRFLQSTCRWAEVSSTRSPLITTSFLLNNFSSINLAISPFVCPLGGGHWHADVVHPWFGRAEEHSGPGRAHPCCGGCDRPGHLHVNVWELRRSNKSGSWPGTAPLHADRRLGHRGLHVSSCWTPSTASTDLVLWFLWRCLAEELSGVLVAPACSRASELTCSVRCNVQMCLLLLPK